MVEIIQLDDNPVQTNIDRANDITLLNTKILYSQWVFEFITELELNPIENFTIDQLGEFWLKLSSIDLDMPQIYAYLKSLVELRKLELDIQLQEYMTSLECSVDEPILLTES